MELEKEIQQTRFKNQYQKLTLNIIFTANWLNLRQIQLFKPYGLSPQQYNILRILRGQHPKVATVSLLSERMMDKSSNASRLVEKLRLKGLIDRAECPEDRRAVNVKITEKGLNLLKKLDPMVDEMEQLVNFINEGEAQAFNDFLDRMRG
jgi:DNA-binding MarR family transcriptional regulator